MKQLPIYFLIILGFTSCGFNEKKMTQTEFDRLLMHDSISYIRITNNEYAEIKIKPFHKNDNIFILPIESSESFQISLDRLGVRLAKQNIYPRYESIISSGSEPIYFDIAYIVISLSIVILFIFTVINVLKNRFESAIDKLIWLFVVLLPIIGPILYLFIGRKQKQSKG